MGIATENIDGLMEMLMDQAKTIRSSFKFSEDEKMVPMAFINTNSELIVAAMVWTDDDDKRVMARSIQMLARTQKAISLSFVTDGRRVRTKEFCEHFNIPADVSIEAYKTKYFEILKQFGGVRNLPRHLWHDVLIVFTNGPTIPLTFQTQDYIEGENDTVKYLETRQGTDQKSDLLTDWWS
jgi:hypothetical protein